MFVDRKLNAVSTVCIRPRLAKKHSQCVKGRKLHFTHMYIYAHIHTVHKRFVISHVDYLYGLSKNFTINIPRDHIVQSSVISIYENFLRYNFLGKISTELIQQKLTRACIENLTLVTQPSCHSRVSGPK